MKKFKFLTVILSLMAFLGLSAGCGGTGSKHTCESACEVCSGCTNEECEEEACKTKCSCEEVEGHTCESKCDECTGCTNEECEEEACKTKCSCEDVEEHTCESECDECGGCTNDACEEEACETKCDCEAEEPAPEHTCESICLECGGCTNAECEEEECEAKCDCEEKPAVVGITLSGAKTEFGWGEDFSVGDLTVKALYEDESEEDLDEYTVDSSAFDNTQAGTYTIKVTYEGVEATYDVTVAEPQLVGIQVRDYKEVFEYNEDFSFGGTVEAVYEDESTTSLSEEEYTIDYTAFALGVPGEYNITVSWNETEFAEIYTVTIKPAKIVSFSLGSYKTKYLVGESLDFSALTAKATRENGDAVNLTAADLTIDSSAYDATTVGAYDVIVSCSEDESISVTIKITVTDKSISILMIGDTFSDDIGYEVPGVLDDLGYVVEMGRISTGGVCSIDEHYANATSAAANYYFRYYQNGAWNNNVYGNKKQAMDVGIEYANWDVITFQQTAGLAGVADSYANLANLVSYVEGKATNDDVKFFFNMTWAYGDPTTFAKYWEDDTSYSNYNNDQMTMYNAIVSATQSEVQTKLNMSIIPVGTAIQNARTSNYFTDGSTTLNARTLTKSKGYYMAALTFAAMVTGEDISNVTYLPKNVAATTAKPEQQICMESVKNALANPFTVTNSTYVKAS